MCWVAVRTAQQSAAQTPALLGAACHLQPRERGFGYVEQADNAAAVGSRHCLECRIQHESCDVRTVHQQLGAKLEARRLDEGRRLVG